MKKAALVKIVSVMAIGLIASSLTACSPEYSPKREPYMSLSTPPEIESKPQGGSEETPDYVNMSQQPMVAPSPHEMPMVDPSSAGNRMFVPMAPSPATKTVTTVYPD